MLDILYKIGQQLSQNADREEFDDYISYPSIDEKERVKNFTFEVVEIVFDLDENEVRTGRIQKYGEADKTYQFSAYQLRCLKIQGGNNKSIYPTVDPRKSFDPWKKTFFGKNDKEGSPPKEAELAEAIRRDFPDLISTELYRVTERVFSLRTMFVDTFPSLGSIAKSINLSGNQKIVMLFASVLAKTEFGIEEPKPVAHLDGFDAFIRRKFLVKGSANPSKSGVKSKLCYTTGEQRDDVSEPDFVRGHNLNKMFVTTTKNYASGFDNKNFGQNYQISNEVQTFLERGSEHMLKNFTVRIAGIDHCILPQFQGKTRDNVSFQIDRLKQKSELLFSDGKAWQYFERDLGDISLLYWITFLGYESNGNFFKTVNLIKDISNTHFERIIKTLAETDREMAEIEGIRWDKVMSWRKDEPPGRFNFNTVYWLIPLHVDKTKKVKATRNNALIIFKSILEGRIIEPIKIYEFFTELIQLHRFERKGFQISPKPKDKFDFATRDAVFQYHAFLHFLKKLNLLEDMTKSPATSSPVDLLIEKDSTIITFFERMGYSDGQKALFYLGRILGSVGYAQSKKGHKTKPVLGKLNFNGMDCDDLQRLHKDLFEKCRQYDVLHFNESNFSKFTGLFTPNDWSVKPEEALFYLLSGYSFRSSLEVEEVAEEPETNSEN